jgi:osmotically-inducible protein OsmY
MKNAFIFLLIGGILGAILFHFYTQREAQQQAAAAPAGDRPTGETATDTPSLSEKAKETAGNVKDTVSDKLAEWHLTSDDIKSDLAKTGQVVRTKAQAVGEKISDARILTFIKAKFVLDSSLSALDISVESHDGEVTLGGTVAAPGLIGRAIILTLDTDGVHSVISKITVAAR